MSQRIDLCSAADVAPGNALKVETGDLVLVVFNVDGEYYVMDDLCTHGPGSLSEGYIEDEESELGMISIAAPIRDDSGDVVAAVGIAGPVTRLSKKSIATVMPHVIATADQVSVRLGYRR